MLDLCRSFRRGIALALACVPNLRKSQVKVQLQGGLEGLDYQTTLMSFTDVKVATVNQSLSFLYILAKSVLFPACNTQPTKSEMSDPYLSRR